MSSQTKKRLKMARKRKHQTAHAFTMLSDGRITLRGILERPPRALGRVHVYDVIRRAPHMGADGANSVLRRAKVWPTTPLNNLTEEERQRVIRHLPPRAS